MLCTSMRLNDQKPTQRWRRASSSWPKVLSPNGIRAMSSTWISNRSDATRALNRPMLVRPLPTCVSSWTPPPETQGATTTNIVHQTKAPQASRHHKGVGSGRAKARRSVLRGGAPNEVVVGPANSTVGEVFMSRRVVEDLGRLLDESYDSALRRQRLRGRSRATSGRAASASCSGPWRYRLVVALARRARLISLPEALPTTLMVTWSPTQREAARPGTGSGDDRLACCSSAWSPGAPLSTSVSTAAAYLADPSAAAPPLEATSRKGRAAVPEVINCSANDLTSSTWLAKPSRF